MERKACPKCGTTLDFRLGMYECPKCGHEEAAAKKEPERKASGPGLRREAWHQPQQSAAGQPLLPGQQQPPAPGTIYTPGAAPPPGLYGGDSPPPPAFYSTLDAEKKIYFAIQAGLSIVILILLFVAHRIIAGIPSALNDPTLRGMWGEIVGGFIFVALMSLLITWFVLFGSQVWAKWTCLGCKGCSAVLFLVGLLRALTVAMFVDMIPGVLQLLFDLWLISILWRDIQAQRGY